MTPLLSVRGLTKKYGGRIGCRNVEFDLMPGEVLGIVGESGSGKTTVLASCSGRLQGVEGSIQYCDRQGALVEVTTADEVELRRLARTEWGFVTQNARDGLRMRVSAGANIAERMMDLGSRHYGSPAGQRHRLARSGGDHVGSRRRPAPAVLRRHAAAPPDRPHARPPGPRLVFLDEPTGGLDVSVQARLLDLLRGLVHDLGLAAVIVTHDLGVARLLADRLLVMQGGDVVEGGLTDRVLDDPQHAYTQLLVSSVLVP